MISAVGVVGNVEGLGLEKLGVRVVRKHVAAFVDAWCEDFKLAPMVETRVALCRIDSEAALKEGLLAALSGWKAAA